jgi:hypothetical protein
MRRCWHPVIRFLASLKLAVVLMVTLAAVLSVATVLEAGHGMAYAHWYVYKSSWFSILLGLLAVNIFAAAAVRFPWKRHQTGFVVTHGGLLVLLVGAIQSFTSGIDGQISIVEGEIARKVTLRERSQITAVWEGRPHEAPYEFSFDGGPVDWSPDRAIDLGEVDGIGARILRFYRHAQPKNEWVAAAAGGGPLVRFRVNGPGGKLVAEHFLADERFGEALNVGPIRVQLQRAANAGMLTDFVQPTSTAPDGDGLLTACYEDAVEYVAVKDNVGRRLPIGSTGAALEIVEYLPNARPDNMGRFVSKGEGAANPMLEIRVHLPDAQEPIRQIAFAKDALLNLDGVYARECPVKFRYRHPAINRTAAVELLQAQDGKLYGRIDSDGRMTPHGVVRPGNEVALGQGFELIVTEYLPHAEKRLSFEAAEDNSEPAALVEIRYDGTAKQVWLQRNDLHYGMRGVSTPDGNLLLRFGNEQIPLGFVLRLANFERQFNPGGEGDAAFASVVQLVDEERDIDESREISMNQPLSHRQFTFYQSGFDESGHGREASVFSVAYDPGRSLKYAGSLMICGGIAVMFYMRAYFFKRAPADKSSTAAADARWPGPTAAHLRSLPPSTPDVHQPRRAA